MTSSCDICLTLRSWRSYRSAVAGVSKKLPPTIVEIKGRPNRRKGYLFRLRRYFAASELPFVTVDEKDFEAKTRGILLDRRLVSEAHKTDAAHGRFEIVGFESWSFELRRWTFSED